MSSRNFHGTIVLLIKEKGYGFIKVKEFGSNLYFHKTGLMDGYFLGLSVGDIVDVCDVVKTKQNGKVRYTARKIYV